MKSVEIYAAFRNACRRVEAYRHRIRGLQHELDALICERDELRALIDVALAEEHAAALVEKYRGDDDANTSD